MNKNEWDMQRGWKYKVSFKQMSDISFMKKIAFRPYIHNSEKYDPLLQQCL